MSGGGHGRKKKGHDEEHVNHERWLVTYADMLTLLMVLFIVLYAMGAENTSKFNQLKASLASAFKNGSPSILSGGSGITPAGQAVTSMTLGPQDPTLGGALGAAKATDIAAAKAEVNQFKGIEKAINKSLADKGLGGKATYTVDKRGLVVTLVTDNTVFPGNSAELQPTGKEILDAVVPPLKSIKNDIEIDGNTNQLKGGDTGIYPTIWELSSARADIVARYMMDNFGISPYRVVPIGKADTNPLIDPKNPAAAERNKRVDVIIQSNLTDTQKALLGTTAANS